MRELKFRVWDKDDKKMYDELTEFMERSYLFDEKVCCFKNKNSDDLRINARRNVKLMQYTGLKDKNGKEIYEGDIIKFYSLDDDFVKGSVYYEFGKFVIGDYVLSNCFRKCEVIGNIFENKDLLEEE